MNSLKHGTDEQLELYSLGRLDPVDTAVLEGHLLICTNCQDRFDRAEAFALGMREALSLTPAVEKTAPKSLVETWFGSGNFGFDWLRKPSFAIAMAMVAILMVAVVFSRSGSRAVLPVASVQLSAMRGEMATVQAAKEMDITLADAPKVSGSYRVEMVDGAGRQIWSGLAPSTEHGVDVKANVVRIEAGSYFLRLYSQSGDLVHEYGLRVTQ